VPRQRPEERPASAAAQHEGAFRIFVRQIAGGRTVMVGSDSSGTQRWTRWSPAGANLPYASEGIVSQVPALGGRITFTIDHHRLFHMVSSDEADVWTMDLAIEARAGVAGLTRDATISIVASRAVRARQPRLR
jgi:hypothetical protein